MTHSHTESGAMLIELRTLLVELIDSINDDTQYEDVAGAMAVIGRLAHKFPTLSLYWDTVCLEVYKVKGHMEDCKSELYFMLIALEKLIQ